MAKHRKTLTEREIHERVMRTGYSALWFLSAVYRNKPEQIGEQDQYPDGFDLKTRIHAAEVSLPYQHSKLSAVKVSGDADNPLTLSIDAKLNAAKARALAHKAAGYVIEGVVANALEDQPEAHALPPSED